MVGFKVKSDCLACRESISRRVTMNNNIISLIFDNDFKQVGDRYFLQGKEILCSNDILRFTPNQSYSTGNFSKLREKHAQLQLDSVNGTNDREFTILKRTNWPREFFKDKLILECGCGAGADTEALLKLGAKVVSVDIAGVDICKANMMGNPSSLVIQGSIMDLPFKKKSFDIVWCHRVLQHTPSPNMTLDHILQFAKADGAVFVHSYSMRPQQVLSWKYVLRPLTRNMEPEKLYRLVERWTPGLFKFTNSLRAIKPDLLGRLLFAVAYQVIPVRNYRFEPKFNDKSDEFIIEYAVHDTFDCLSPRYDRPLTHHEFRKIAKRHLKHKYEIVEQGCTLLRSVVKK